MASAGHPSKESMGGGSWGVLPLAPQYEGTAGDQGLGAKLIIMYMWKGGMTMSQVS